MKNVPKQVINKKTSLLYKKYFLSKKRKSISPFRTEVPIRSHDLLTVGPGAASNRKIVKPVRTLVSVSNKLNCSWI